MKLLKNPDFKREIIVDLTLTAVFALSGLFLSPACAALAGGGCLALCIVHFVFLLRRYGALSRLCDEIDAVVHGQRTELISEVEEGELSILTSQIGKMTVRLRDQADRLQKEKAVLYDAVADISHQLRTPMTAMNLVVSMLAQENLEEKERLRLTRELKRQLERTQWLVETLLKMSRLDAGAVRFLPERVAVRRLIDRACEPLSIPMELRGQTLSLRVGGETLEADESWMTEALGNLIKNCSEHTPEGGTISVSAQETALYTEIVIKDTGPGFAKEDLPRLFERFYRGKNENGPGIGIGLSLARAIITAQGGALSASNASEGGAQFNVRFYKTVI